MTEAIVDRDQSRHWRVLAFASLIVAVVAVTTATIVLGLNDVDALASIALSLAILSFVIQLILFVLQANTSNQQLLQSQQLNSETQKLLEEVRVRATSTQDLLSGQFNTLLEHALGGVADKAEAKTGIDASDLQAIMREAVFAARQQPAVPMPPAQSRSPRVASRRSPTPDDIAILARLESRPTDNERDAALAEIRTLPLAALREFVKYVEDEFESRKNGTIVGFVGDLSAG